MWNDFHLFFVFILFILQKDLFNQTHCWCQRVVCLITFIMRHVAGHLCDGIKQALLHVRNVICKCAVSQCSYHAVFLCSLALNLSVVQSILKVSKNKFLAWLQINRKKGEKIWNTKKNTKNVKWIYHSISHLRGSFFSRCQFYDIFSIYFSIKS